MQSPAERVAWWRYVPPNAVTCGSLVLSAIAMQQALAGYVVSAAWWAILCVATDRLDGLLAGALRARSSFGVQLDSMADLACFGCAPAIIYYACFISRPELGWSTGGALLALRALTCVWLLAVAIRLARFNVQAAKGGARWYTGVPSTMASGTVVTFLLTCLKYSAPHFDATFDRWRALGNARLDGVLHFAPLALAVGAGLMLSPLRVPKLGKTKWLAINAVLFPMIAFGLFVGVTRRLPEYLVATGVAFVGVACIHDARTRAAQRSGV